MLGIPPNITPQQVRDFVTANANNPQAIADAMRWNNITMQDIYYATGYTYDQIAQFVLSSKNQYLINALNQWTAQLKSNPNKPDLRSIKDFVVANINNPAKIAEAMKQYGVSIEEIAAIFGYTYDQVKEYAYKSNVQYLIDELNRWDKQRPANANSNNATTAVYNANAAGQIIAVNPGIDNSVNASLFPVSGSAGGYGAFTPSSIVSDASATNTVKKASASNTTNTDETSGIKPGAILALLAVAASFIKG